MNTSLTINLSASSRYKVAEILIEFLKIYLVIVPLQILFKRRLKKSRTLLENCSKNTIGSDILKMLEENNLDVIPFYEEHDLKHLVLNYGMTSEEEIKMQAFLFGNGDRSTSCLLFLFSGIIMPSAWSKFYKEYKRGKLSPDISNLKLEKCKNLSTANLKYKYRNCL